MEKPNANRDPKRKVMADSPGKTLGLYLASASRKRNAVPAPQPQPAAAITAAQAIALYIACRSYIRARTDGGKSMADLSGIADANIRAAVALVETAEPAAPVYLWARELKQELEKTNEFALELMHRAATIDRKLLEATGSPLECELGEIVRLRQQLGRNRMILAKTEEAS
jgi:hypothetical protein